MKTTHDIPQDILDGYSLLGIDAGASQQVEQERLRTYFFQKYSKYSKVEVGVSQNSITFMEVQRAELARRAQRN